MDKVERQRQHFNAVAGRYQEARQGEAHLLLKSLIWREVAQSLALSPGATYRVLEAMCGYADGYDRLRECLPDCRFAYSGFDYSDAVVERLRRMRPELAVDHRDVTIFEHPPAFDIVMLLGGLHHVPDHAGDIVRRLAGAVLPGGHVLSFEPTDGNPLSRAVRQFIYRRNDLFDAATERAFRRDELTGFFTAAGLQPVRIFHPGLLAYVLYYNPDAFPALNRGGAGMVRATFALDRCFMDNAVGAVLSFATFSIWRKPHG